MPRSFADYYLRIYFEIYLWAKKKMVYPYHDFVKLIFDRIVALPKQLTLSLFKAPRLLYAGGFNSMPIGTGGYVDVRLKGDFYSIPRVSLWSWTQPTQYGALVRGLRFNDARGEARLQHIKTELDQAGFWLTLRQGGTTRRINANTIDYIRDVDVTRGTTF